MDYTYSFAVRKQKSVDKVSVWNWNKYFERMLELRKNWKYVPYQELNRIDSIDLCYPISAELARKTKVCANIYHFNQILGLKDNIIKDLQKIHSKFVPKTHYINQTTTQEKLDKYFQNSEIYYLKATKGSFGRATFLVRSAQEVKKVLTEHNYPEWILSENVDSYIYKRNGKYFPDGLNYKEEYGHKGKLRFMLLFHLDNTHKKAYMYNKGIYELAPAEFRGDYSSRVQNVVGATREEEEVIFKQLGYSDKYDTDMDYALKPETVFGDDYSTVILPQLLEMSHDIFKVSNEFLNCKNGILYNDNFKSCFQLAAVDVIVDPSLKCHFLEINSKPFMSYEVFEERMNYDSLVDGVLKLCVDPYLPPQEPVNLPITWVEVMNVDRNANFNVYYSSDKLKISKDLVHLLNQQGSWRPAIYPRHILKQYHIDFAAKRKKKLPEQSEFSLDLESMDLVFKNSAMISKIHSIKHFLGNKKTMYDILSNDPECFEFLPLTATLSTKQEDWKEVVKTAMNFDKNIKVWIAKPALGLQGTDIIISDNENTIIDHIDKIKFKDPDWVISQYIDNPLLVKLKGKAKSGFSCDDTIGRKSHIRLYVLVTNLKDKTPKVYLYEDNLLFVGVKEYNKSDFKEKESNLTNLYVASSYYNSNGLNGKRAYKELSFSLKKVVKHMYPGSPGFYNRVVYPQLKYMLHKIIKNFKNYLLCINKEAQGYKGCFQNIAIDIMPDENFKLWLLEINANPGMNAPSYHWKGLEKFTNSILSETTNIVFPSKKKIRSNKGFKLIK